LYKFAILPCILIVHFSFGQKSHKYPIAPKDSTSDVYFEEIIADPYQWMEDPSDPRLSSWLEEQAAITKKQSNKQTRVWELRQQIATMFTETKRSITDDYEKRTVASLSKYVFKTNTNNFSKSPDLLYKLRTDDNYRFLIRVKDLEVGKEDHIIYTTRLVNEEYDLAVVTLSLNGSDWEKGYFFDLSTGKEISQPIENLRSISNLAWHEDVLYYDAYKEPLPGRELLDNAKGQKLFKVSPTKHDEPLELYQNPDTTGTNPFQFNIHENKLILYHFLKSRGELLKTISIADLEENSFFPKNFLIVPNDVSLIVRQIFNDSVLLQTNWNAPNERVLLANINQPNQLSEFIPQYDLLLRDVNKLGKDKFVCIYTSKGQYTVLIINHQGEVLDKIDFPKVKKLNDFYELDDNASYTSFNLSSFYHPHLWYQISLSDLTFKPVQNLSVPYNPELLETRYVTYLSADSTEIPMYITCKKDIKLNGKNPVLLYGYGGYGRTIEPTFSESYGLFLLHGGVLAMPNIRGGGAKGDQWALDGRRLKKQNAIDDFVSAAEYLISEGYTQSEKLAVYGASHGGMLVGAAITQRPELFHAALIEAGPMDMLRLHKYTAGALSTNIIEFGIPTNKEDYKNLRSYSPLHNIESGIYYPNTLLITGDHDDRVPPHHSYKFLATLQEKGDPKGLYHMYLVPGAGHGGALTGQDWVDLELFKYYFLFDQLGIDFY
jgi:prolyl oligopeptidase